jgi:hypothetical protein
MIKTNKLFFAFLFIFLLSPALPIPLSAATPPELPRIFLDTTYPSLSSSRTIRVVKSSCGEIPNCYTSLQKAIDEASLGDEIVIDAGLVIDGPITLKEKTLGSGWIIIRSGSMFNLPPPGSRVSPSHAQFMPKIVAPGSNLPAMRAADRAHHYRIVGIEFREKVPNDDSNVLIQLGKGESYCATPTSLYVVCTDQSVLDQYSHNIVLDRVYVHGEPTHNVKAGVGLNNKSSAVIDSYISDIHVVGQDAQAIVGAWGPGPYKIVNNYLEGAGENIIFGGDDPRVEGLIPSDIEIRGNYLYKPLSWRQGDPTFNGRAWTVKNLFELKNAQRVLVDGNIMENNWAHAQPGVAILFNTSNQGGKCTWCAVMDVTFTNNIVRHSGGGMSFQANDYVHASVSTGRTKRIKVSNNLFYDLSGSKWKNLSTNTNAASYLFYLPSGASKPGPEDVEISNNTAFHTGNMISVGHKTDTTFWEKPGFVYKNNIAAHNSYGVFGEGTTGFDGPSITAYFPGGVFTNNIIMGQRSSTDTRDWSANYKDYPGNFFPKSWSDVGFTNFSGGNFALSGSSEYKNVGTDGQDIGVNWNVLNAATANTISGNSSGSFTPPPSSPVPSPSPAPAPSTGGGSPSPAPRTSAGGGGGGFSSGTTVVSAPSTVLPDQTDPRILALQAQISSLMAQIKALNGNPDVVLIAGTSNTPFTQDLTIGSTGSQVIALQQMLVSRGFLVMPAGVAYGYFGELTRSAVARWQAANGISPAVGYFGPISRSKINN